jgi:8-oxo-dGTP pyrophosphatase MutT (NUDIX family)
MTERWKPSVTVAAIVERRVGVEREFLLVEEHTPEGLRLNNPAGHLEPGETPEAGVRREALEETGCTFTPSHLVGIYLSRFVRAATGEDVTYLRFAFAGSAGAPDPARPLDHGIVRTVWLGLDALRASRARHRSELVLQCIEDHCAGRAFPLDAIRVGASLDAPGEPGAASDAASAQPDER